MTGLGSVLTFLKPLFSGQIADSYKLAVAKMVESGGWFASAAGALAA
jgi:hypothetical protein